MPIPSNEDHKDVEFHEGYCSGQDCLIGLVKEPRPDDEVSEWLDYCRRWGATEGIDKVTSDHGADVVVCCSEATLQLYRLPLVSTVPNDLGLLDQVLTPNAQGYPMAAVPLGYIESSGTPYGLQAIAPAYEEAKLVKFNGGMGPTLPPQDEFQT
ncbi:hypothetical protein QQZ08_002224 [Neonectria magnoliae]|uniref:Amidase domain-containing protein n=1 Tax=Neonectria magnoliae TaxID=2732573 RepID=A0ABR1ICC2_9HYPO